MRLESGALGRAGGSVRRLDRACTRRSSCATEGRSGAARASPGRSRTSTARSPRRVRGLDAADQRALDERLIELDGTPNKGRLGRERDPRRLAGDGEGGGRGGRRLALPPPRRRGGADAAGADDERDQRRRPRAELDRPAGVHARPGRRGELRGGAADRLRDLPRARRAAARARASRPASATRVASRPTSRSSEEAIEALLEAAERAGHRERIAVALDPAATELYRGRPLRVRGPRRGRRGHGRVPRRSWPRGYPIVSIEDGLAEDDWDDLAGADRAARRPACSSSATTSS